MTAATPRPDVVARLRAAGCVWAEDEAGLLEDAAASADELDRLVARRASSCPAVARSCSRGRRAPT